MSKRKTAKFNTDGIGDLAQDKPVVYRLLNSKGENVYTGSSKKGQVAERIKDHLPGGADPIPGVKKVRIEQHSSIARFERVGGEATDLSRVMARARVIIATSGIPGLILVESVRTGQIVLALSNPNPEITPDAALQAGAVFAVDGRAVNNALGFPGIFRGALDARARCINDPMKIAAAKTIAAYAEPEELVPPLLHPDLHQAVAESVVDAARTSGASPPGEDLPS